MWDDEIDNGVKNKRNLLPSVMKKLKIKNKTLFNVLGKKLISFMKIIMKRNNELLKKTGKKIIMVDNIYIYICSCGIKMKGG